MTGRVTQMPKVNPACFGRGLGAGSRSLKRSLVLAGLSVSTLAVSETDVLAQRDAAYRHGFIEYRYKAPSPAPDAQVSSLDYRGKLVFDADGSMLERLEKPQNLGEGVNYATFVKGKDWRYTEIENGDGVRVTFEDAEAWLRSEDARTMVQAVPCGPLGLGLGKATGVQESKGENLKFSGAVEEGLIFRLTLHSDGTPTQLDYLNGDRLFGTWTYSGSLVASPSLRLPAKAEFRAPWLGEKGDRNFEFLKADLGKAPKAEELVTEWFRPGVSIVDRRVNPPVAWSYGDLLKENGGSTKLTPLQLLGLSKSRSDGEARTTPFPATAGIFTVFLGLVGFGGIRRSTRRT